MQFIEGEEVLARQPNHEEFQKGRIVSIKGSSYRVQFKGGKEFTLKESDMKSSRTSRSSTRSKTRNKKSPRNSPSRKSPSRKSPSRNTNTNRKLTVRASRLTQASASDDDILDHSSEASGSIRDDPLDVIPLQSRIQNPGPTTRRSIRIMTSSTKAEHEQKLSSLRGIDRAASLPGERKNLGYDSQERGLSLQSDKDLLKVPHYNEGGDSAAILDKHRKGIDRVSKLQEFGALVLILLTPVGAILLQYACTNGRCSISQLRVYKDFKYYLNPKAFLLYAGFLFYVVITNLLPIGKVIDGHQTRIGRLRYRINGFLTGLLTVIVFGLFEYKGYKIANFILNNSLQITLAAYIYGLLLAIILYIKGGRTSVINLNISGVTNSRIYNFWLGRENNPRFGPVDVKFNFIRAALIASILVCVAVIVKAFETKQHLPLSTVNLTAIVAAALQIVYMMDALIFEASFLSSFEIMYEGTGYMLCTGYLLYPFLCTLHARFALYNKSPQSPYFLALLIVFFFIGYGLYRLSNNQKDLFRRNPLHPSLTRLETIPTVQGRKLLVSGLWGHVRHPNYLGDIILHWSMALLILRKDLLPYFNAILVTLLLMHRAIRDNERCHQRYGLAWEEYCSRVKYMIIKGIF